MPAMDVIFFATPDELRAWFAAHHETAGELWVGFHKKGTGTPSVTWPEAVDEALCVGWIDGVRKGIDAASYTIRFTPRKPGSIWSAVNIARVAELERQGRMRPAGLAAFARRREAKSAVYAYEQETPQLDADSERRFRANATAWDYFQAQTPSYQRTATWWIVSAKQAATRQKRLATLIADSEQGRRLAHLSWKPRTQGQ
ncbi:MAG TPA: YdeI/OmpD-associated family protein [Ktedonobacterales bacterium]|nr:YdeI/OmpD-associated family protein [Ktedonobacterales bacterium]